MKIQETIQLIANKIVKLISDKFTGELMIKINFNCGGITRIRTSYEEELKSEN